MITEIEKPPQLQESPVIASKEIKKETKPKPNKTKGTISAKDKLKEKLKAKTVAKHGEKGDKETIEELRAKLDALLAKTSASH